MSTLIVERDGGVVRLTLNRPEKKNAITGEMWDELDEAFRSVASNRGARVLVVTGAGDALCSGLNTSTKDAVEAVRAFRERRPPNFTGE